jgi:hypothetical protein
MAFRAVNIAGLLFLGQRVGDAGEARARTHPGCGDAELCSTPLQIRWARSILTVSPLNTDPDRRRLHDGFTTASTGRESWLL